METHHDVDETPPNLFPDPPPPPPLRRRPSASRSTITRSNSSSSDRRSKLFNELRDDNRSVIEAPEASSSTVTSSPMNEPQDGTAESPSGSFLFSIAGFVIKAIFFQLNFLFTFFKLPVRLLYFSFMLVYDPFGMKNVARNFVKMGILWVGEGFLKRYCPSILGRLSEQGLWKMARRLASSCFWSVYVAFVLLGILVTAFLGGRLLMRSIVEEPLQIVRELNFDYTKQSPVAHVPIDTGGLGCNFDWDEKDAIGKQLDGRVVPMHHKLSLVISLALPESDYNRKLGMFQVRAEFLSANGKVIFSSSKPCMLQFKSSPIRFAETFLKSSTLLSGFVSESQFLKIKMSEFAEGNEPTACVKIILEQRAEYMAGAGIPEIYSTSLKLESELSLLKRIIWKFRWTIFIWLGIMVFFVELLIVLVCCRPIIIPGIMPTSETVRRAQSLPLKDT